MSYKVKTVPRIKTIKNVFKFLDNPIPLINDTLREMGAPSYRVHLGGINRSFMTKDPLIIQHVLQKNHKNYFKSKLQSKSIAKYAGKGLLTTNGEYWLRQRRLIQPGFHKKKLEALVENLNKVTLQHVEQLKERINKGERQIELMSNMINLTLKIVSNSLFSSGVSDQQLGILSKGVIVSQIAITKDIRQPFFKWWRSLSGEQKGYMSAVKEVRLLLLNFIQERRKSEGKFDDLLDMLLASKYEDTNEGMTDEQLIDEILIIFAAGHETTANALTWSLYLLDQNPIVLNKLKQHIDEITLPEVPTFKDVMSLDYCRQVTAESMRIFPPAWMTDRIALEEDEINGIKINKGELVGLFIYGAHHSVDLWDEPESFRPERFTRENMKSIPPFAYFPFGGGPRLCIGQQFAQLEMQLVLFHLIKNFDFALKKDHPIEMQPLVTLRPKHGMIMNLSLR